MCYVAWRIGKKPNHPTHKGSLANTKMNVGVNTGTFPVSQCPWSPFQFVFTGQSLDYFNKICDFINKITTSFHFCYNILEITTGFGRCTAFCQFSKLSFGVLLNFTWTFCPAGLGVYQDVSGVAASSNLCRQLPATGQMCSCTEVWKSY